MQQKKVEFSDKQKRPIIGDLLLPDSNSRKPVVIVCHGFKGNRNERHIRAIAEALTRPGLVTLRFDFTQVPGESSLPFANMTVSYELEVLDQAVAFTKTISEIDPEKIALVGHSLGGLVVGWYAATHPEIAAVAPLSGVYSFVDMWTKKYGEKTVRDFKEKGFAYVFSKSLNRPLKINDSFYEDAINYDMDKVIENLSCPILAIHGTADEAVPLEHSKYFVDRSKSSQKQLKIVQGADHIYSKSKDLEEVKNSVADWFAKTLLR